MMEDCLLWAVFFCNIGNFLPYVIKTLREDAHLLFYVKKKFFKIMQSIPKNMLIVPIHAIVIIFLI